ACEALKSAAEDNDAPLAEEALRALVKIEKDALPTVRQLLAGDKRQRAVADLQKIGESSLPFLGDALSAKHVEVRRSAAQAIVTINVKQEALIAPLTRALRDPDKEVRRASLHGLKNVAIAAKEAIPSLLGCLKEKDADMRVLTLSVIREI